MPCERSEKGMNFNMKFDFDEFSFQDEINLIHLNNQMENLGHIKFNETIGFNEDTIYSKIEEK